MRYLILSLLKSPIYTPLYINGLYINLYINLYIQYTNSSVYILIYILRSNTLFYCAMAVYIPFILFKSDRVWFEKYKTGIYFVS